ncbi:TPA: hypothetical protein JI107_18000 [Acinetobacter baumannii]|nr:hypothetical protein [Acinetobacter baumannii]
MDFFIEIFFFNFIICALNKCKYLNMSEDKATKTAVTDMIKAIRVGELDPSNNKIVLVHSKYNEYAIYEIETSDINDRLRVIIDGHTDESEQAYTQKFNTVKQKYIQATGMLANTPNMNMLKRRIAHTLSTCLSGNIDGIKEFDGLIKTIQEEHERLVLNRFLYVLPVLIVTLIFLILSLVHLNIYKIEGMDKVEKLYFYILFLCVSIGASISLLINASKLNFEEYSSKFYYCLLGAERLFLAICAGVTAFMFVKAGLLFPEFTKNSIWGLMVALTLAGFSESLIPSYLAKVNTDK